MSDSELLHRMLYQALIEIRDVSRESGDKASYHLADLFHVVALELGQAADSKRTYSEVLDSLVKRAESKGCARWLDERMRKLRPEKSIPQITTCDPATSPSAVAPREVA